MPANAAAPKRCPQPFPSSPTASAVIHPPTTTATVLLAVVMEWLETGKMKMPDALEHLTEVMTMEALRRCHHCRCLRASTPSFVYWYTRLLICTEDLSEVVSATQVFSENVTFLPLPMVGTVINLVTVGISTISN
jgi:hypothetical protein